MLQSGSAIHARQRGRGILIAGIGVEDDADDDGDGEENEADDNAGANILVFGEAPALHIESNGVDALNVGATASGYGLHVRGVLEGRGVYDDVDATGIRIEGASGANVNIAGGVAIDGASSAIAYNSDAYGLYIGSFVDTPEVLVRGTLSAAANSNEAADAAYGLYITSDANVPTLTNTGSIFATVNGEHGTAAAITDLSGTVSLITNSGEIIAQLTPTAVVGQAPNITGDAIAIDLSISTIGVTLNQIPDTPFTDDDPVDDDEDSALKTRIVGVSCSQRRRYDQSAGRHDHRRHFGAARMCSTSMAAPATPAS